MRFWKQEKDLSQVSRKLLGGTNGIWTVKLFLGEEKLLPPFLIMKEEGEVWQLATGEVSVCWKCGKPGHIGDKCHQDVSALAASLAGPAESHQPSWAHVVRGASPLHPRPPPLPAGPGVGVLAAPVTGEGLRLSRMKLARRLSPPQPPVRDENGEILQFGRVLENNISKCIEKAVDRVLEVTIENLMKEIMKSYEHECMDIFVVEALGRVERERSWIFLLMKHWARS